MRRFAMIIAGVLLAIGAVAIAPAPAAGSFDLPVAKEATEAPHRPAHNWDTYSYWHCGATRLHDWVFVTHSMPSDLAPGYVFYYCTSDQLGGGHKEQWWAVASVDTGESAVWIPWRFCYLGEPCAPEPN